MKRIINIPKVGVDIESKITGILIAIDIKNDNLFLEKNDSNLYAFIDEKPVLKFSIAQMNPKYLIGKSMLLK